MLRQHLCALRAAWIAAVLLLPFALAALPAVRAQDTTAPAAARAPLAVVVLEQDGAFYTARQVLEAGSARDPSLLETVERDPAYRAIYLASPNFLHRVQAFSDWLLVDGAGIPPAGEEALLAEAAAWARDHGSKATAEGALASHPLEIEARARLITLQPPEFATAELRTHLYRSVPEFFGELACSWIRVPLVDLQTGRALTSAKRRARYEELDDLARRLESGETSWEDAIDRYALAEIERERKGSLGFVRRTMVERFEEPFLRHTFEDLGIKNPTGDLLRGPIAGDRWMYLVRIETIRTRGVVDLEQVRPRVERSLREHLLQQKMTELRNASERKLLAPVLP